LLAKERFDEAAEVIEDALVKHQSEAGVERVLGDLDYREGRIFDAEKAYKAALKLDPRSARAIYGISRVFQASCLRKKASEMRQIAYDIDVHDARIASAFYSADRRSQAAIARMEAEFARHRGAADGKAESASEPALMWIAEAKGTRRQARIRLIDSRPTIPDSTSPPDGRSAHHGRQPADSNQRR
jgi:tetratricopeptide (TPR) repeat protein